NMLKYKTARAGKGYIEVNRFFASSKTSSSCMQAQTKMPLEIRMCTCDKSGTKHDRDINASINIRNEAQLMITAGIVVTANGGTVSRGAGRKSSIARVPLKLETPSFTAG
ncbi:MAG: transposase, partial [Methylotenera sp.]|nr:transposase [Methylotenera sp.]